VSALRLNVGGVREVELTLPESTPAPGEALLGAVSFLVHGLDGAAPEEIARAIARVVADELPGFPLVEARIMLGPGVTARAASAREAVPSVEEHPFGLVDVVDERESFGVYRLRVAPGRAIPTHEHRRMDEWEYALRGALALQGDAFPLGDAVRWPLRFAHRWENHGETEAVVLCIDRPRFDAADEILVEAASLEKCPLRFRPRFALPSP